MQTQINNLGKVSITVDKDYWDINNEYDRLTIVEVEHKYCTYLSRKDVPSGIDVSDRNYWIPFSSLTENVAEDIRNFKTEITDIVRELNNKIAEIESISIDELNNILK